MNALDGDLGNDAPEVLWEHAERVFFRLRSGNEECDRYAFMPTRAGREHSMLHGARRLVHEYELKDYLDAEWALRPIELVREHGQTSLFVEFSGGIPLDRLVRQPMEIERFLRLAPGTRDSRPECLAGQAQPPRSRSSGVRAQPESRDRIARRA